LKDALVAAGFEIEKQWDDAKRLVVFAVVKKPVCVASFWSGEVRPSSCSEFEVAFTPCFLVFGLIED
jgi:hypothetical protein